MKDERSVKCLCCKGKLYYRNNKKFKPEYRIELEGCDYNGHKIFKQYYMHKSCWRSLMKYIKNRTGGKDSWT